MLTNVFWPKVTLKAIPITPYVFLLWADLAMWLNHFVVLLKDERQWEQTMDTEKFYLNMRKKNVFLFIYFFKTMTRGQTLQQVVWRGCGVSNLGDAQNVALSNML